jgi:hypothetical protein
VSAPAVAPATQDAHDYLTAVERELDDLPAEERTALVEDLALHLEALAGEDDDRPIAVRLGDPVAYAADLRSAAGLPARSQRTPGAGLQARWAAVLATPTAQRVLPAGRELRRLVRELRPAWWVLRGYLLVFVASAAEVDSASDFPVPAPFDSPVLGLLLVVAAVAGSVALGRRTLPGPLNLVIAAGGVILVLLSLAISAAASDRYPDGASPYAMPYQPAYEQAMGEYPLLSRYGPVTDVFPYAADGTPLENVLLYDQDGRPLQVGVQEWWQDECFRVLEQPLAADGVPVPHSFPQNYELFGSGVDIHTAQEVPGRCVAEVPRPDIPLPVFPPTPAEPIAPAPGD